MRKLTAHFWKTMIVLTGLAVSLTGCSHRESPPPAVTEEHHEGDPMEHNVGTKPMGAPPRQMSGKIGDILMVRRIGIWPVPMPKQWRKQH